MATAEKVMQFRLKTEDKELIERGAALSGVTASQFVLRAARIEAQHLEADRAIFSVGRKPFAAFVEALDAPVVPDKALHKLLHTQAPWD
ncbi:MAG: hypothetical protein BMS9Abin32_146 [Gammaproteobacteria bacterium]|nr:MAG: hypothetical protein BMS9Abin32_146 [Gammaproteobacteria bacterium]